MSSSQRHRRSRRLKTLCAACQERKARFRYRGEVRADRDHTLCFQCYRAEINRTRSRRLREPASPPVLRSSSSPQDLARSRVLDARRSRTDSACSTTCSARLAPRRDGSSYPAVHSFGAPERVVRLGAARVRSCRTATISPLHQRQYRPRRRTARDRWSREQARTGACARRRRPGSAFAFRRR